MFMTKISFLSTSKKPLHNESSINCIPKNVSIKQKKRYFKHKIVIHSCRQNCVLTELFWN